VHNGLSGDQFFNLLLHCTAPCRVPIPIFTALTSLQPLTWTPPHDKVLPLVVVTITRRRLKGRNLALSTGSPTVQVETSVIPPRSAFVYERNPNRQHNSMVRQRKPLRPWLQSCFPLASVRRDAAFCRNVIQLMITLLSSFQFS
jgi:hypothetical protein